MANKLNIKAFSREVKELRDGYDADFGSYREYLRDEMAGMISAGVFVSDEWKAVQAVVPATYEEIVSNLSVAAARRQQFGASAEQIATIARLAVRDRLPLSAIEVNVLTASEAANIIASF
jgi:hypothetical protein